MSIFISLDRATATAKSIEIRLTGNSARYALAPSKGVAVSAPFAFESMSITDNAVVFGVKPGAVLRGTVTLHLAPAQRDDRPPVLLINNLDLDGAMVTYPTNNGPMVQLLTSGQEIALSGFAHD